MKRFLSCIVCVCLVLGAMSMVLSVGATVSEQAVDTIKVVTIGDFITNGIHYVTADSDNTARFDNAYPNLLVQKLNQQNDGNTYELVNMAIDDAAVVGSDVIFSNDTATSWYNQSKNKIGYADILTIMLGTNDAGANWSQRRDMFDNLYRQIVTAFQAVNPSLRLYVITSPYTEKSPYYANLENDIIPMQKNLATKLGATLIDVYHYTKLQVQKNGERSFIDSVDMANGLRIHPSREGHALMGDIVYAGVSGNPLPDYVLALDGQTTTTGTTLPTTAATSTTLETDPTATTTGNITGTETTTGTQADSTTATATQTGATIAHGNTTTQKNDTGKTTGRENITTKTANRTTQKDGTGTRTHAVTTAEKTTSTKGGAGNTTLQVTVSTTCTQAEGTAQKTTTPQGDTSEDDPTDKTTAVHSPVTDAGTSTTPTQEQTPTSTQRHSTDKPTTTTRYEGSAGNIATIQPSTPADTTTRVPDEDSSSTRTTAHITNETQGVSSTTTTSHRDDAPANTKRSTGAWVWILIGILLLAGGGIAYFLLVRKVDTEPEEDTEDDPEASVKGSPHDSDEDEPEDTVEDNSPDSDEEDLADDTDGDPEASVKGGFPEDLDDDLE